MAAGVPATPAAAPGAVLVPEAAVADVVAGAALDVAAPPKRLGVALLDVVAVPAAVGAELEVAAAVLAGGFPKSEGVWLGALVAADVVVPAVVAGVEVVAAENKVEGFDAGVDPEPAPPPRPPKDPRADDAVVVGALLAGVVVAAGFAPKSEGVLELGVDSAGLEAAVAPPKRLEAGVEEVPAVFPPNNPDFCVDAEVEAVLPPPKRLGPELLAGG